ncbi:FAD-dependent monooxygenase [Parasphingopyxis algicola]|uniref:FAD-dependent oxidoreductase n=1 Tax=Parasphingopyxis algicola TaxID=2026624 RepID=UPI0015A28D9B|nr:NAD(P)/FAD-dependent oxidoreductase [Parasphingopyxis algicola]QLC26377.1 FAD-dependent monooxygenase [Parasphingopyxis algicola]
MKQHITQVAIAGAGPVGTVAAYALARKGIDVFLLESGSDCAPDLRASTFHPPTLEMLDSFGVTEKLIERGLKAPIYHFRERRSGEVIEFDMGEIADATRYPYRIQCEQYHLSRMLSRLVRDTPVAQVAFNHRVVGFHQDCDGVDVFAETPVDIAQIRADYLIGADGANSIIRKWLGVEFHGFTYNEKFVCYTTPEPIEKHIENLCYVNYLSDPEEWMVLLKVPGIWRILVPAPALLSDEEILSDERTTQVFERLIDKGGSVTTRHRTIYQVHQRVAKEFLHGRVVIIGDAAHLNNPLGGFGMNSGIHDAFNLTDKLIRIYKGREDADTALETFAEQRKKTTHHFIQKRTKENMRYMSGGQEAAHEQRKREMREIRNDPARRRQFLLQQAMIESLEAERA